MNIQTPFKTKFLNNFKLIIDQLPFTNQEIVQLDKELDQYEQIFLNPDIEKSLISKNELLASFAISKAEDSTLTIKEAQEVYKLLLSDPNFDFIGQKLKQDRKLTQKDYEKLEFFNIAKTFKELNRQNLTLKNITPALVKKIHNSLTAGLDIFKNRLPLFTVYKSGKWRDNDKIRIDDYVPAPHRIIKQGVGELLRYIKNKPTVISAAVFHTALYALHPFNNGNKRVCRVLEHIILRQLGLNAKNIYSASYYYHKEKARYYKYLLFSLKRKNLNHFVAFSLEAIVLSIIMVVKTSLEVERENFLTKQNLDASVRKVLRPLVKRQEIQFKNLYKQNRGKIARQTLVTYLNNSVKAKILKKRAVGRTTYYSLNISLPEEEALAKWLKFAKERLAYIPDNILLA